MPDSVATEAVKVAYTGPETVVLLADVYVQGGGAAPAFTARMIVSEFDIAPEIPGVQNVWIQGVGCGSAKVRFNPTLNP